MEDFYEETFTLNEIEDKIRNLIVDVYYTDPYLGLDYYNNLP